MLTLSPCGIDTLSNDADFLLLEEKGLRFTLPASQQDVLLPLRLFVRRGALKALLPPCSEAPEAPLEAGVWLLKG